jgi:hypothetical protein
MIKPLPCTNRTTNIPDFFDSRFSLHRLVSVNSAAESNLNSTKQKEKRRK